MCAAKRCWVCCTGFCALHLQALYGGGAPSDGAGSARCAQYERQDPADGPGGDIWWQHSPVWADRHGARRHAEIPEAAHLQQWVMLVKL